MQISLNKAAEWLQIWPCELEQVHLLNVCLNVCPQDSESVDVFAHTPWKRQKLQIRGNCLAAYEILTDVLVPQRQTPTHIWLLEHCSFDIRQNGKHLTLPKHISPQQATETVTLYVIDDEKFCMQKSGNPSPSTTTRRAKAMFAIFFSNYGHAETFATILRRCSLSYLKHLVENASEENTNGHVAVATLASQLKVETLEYKNKLLNQQCDSLKLNNTLLLNHFTANKQAFAETSQLLTRENTKLKNELQAQQQQIEGLEKQVENLKNELQAVCATYGDLKRQQRKSENINDAFNNDEAEPKSNNLKTTSTDGINVIDDLKEQIKREKRLNAKLANTLNALNNNMTRQLQIIREMITDADIYALLHSWIKCNQLKVKYYEKGTNMEPRELQALMDQIVKAQEHLRQAHMLATAAYTNYKTLHFDKLLSNVIDEDDYNVKLSRQFQRTSMEIIQELLDKTQWLFELDPDAKGGNKGNASGSKAQAPTSPCHPELAIALEPVVPRDMWTREKLHTLQQNVYKLSVENERLQARLKQLSKVAK